MGNTGWRLEEQREVVLCLHSVHNVQHSPNESYYGMATDHASEVEIPVTSERPARLMAGIDSVLSVRIFLHNRGFPSTTDRPVGQLSLPVREMLDTCGPGLYQTWFLLDAPTPYGGMQRSHTVERFLRALHGVSMELHASRICLSLLDSSTDPAEWPKDDKDRITYFEPVLISHQQHVQITQAYFDYIERAESSSAARTASKKGGVNAQAPVEASALKAELERLQQQQREEEVTLLQRELDQITEEANRRIEKGNGVIVKLKADLKHLRDVEAAQLQCEHAEAEQRVQTLRQEGQELRQRLENSQDDAAADADLQNLQQEVLVLTNQKDALMKMVQDIYGTAQAAAAGGESNAKAAAARAALASIQGPQIHAQRECKAEDKLLPDAHELLSEPLKPLG
mmetsp:Transcript_66979/g.207097  ORF Transcript_66979/g.207097 Transcript_66979/m.207097 type:complete len:398 (-) Transcript_66979:49-1242(-)